MKIGDKVEVVESIFFAFPVGSTGTITHTEDRGLGMMYIVEDTLVPCDWPMEPHELKVIT